MVDAGLAPREGTPERHPLAGYPCTNKDHAWDGSVRDENGVCAKCEAEKRPPSNEEILTSVMYAKELERFHCLDGLKDGFCPCCGGPVNVVDNGHGTGVKIEARWK